jgi:hypothetical protein
MRIETDSASPVSGLIKVGGVEYNIGAAMQGIVYDHTGDYEEVVYASVGSTPNVMSMGFMFRTGINTDWSWWALTGMLGSNEWALLAPRYFSGAMHLYVHGAAGYSSGSVTVSLNTWYWVTIQYNRTAGYGYLSVYNPSTWEQVGSTLSLAFTGSPSAVSNWVVGQNANQWNTGAYSTWYGPVILDWTDGTFPLLPSPV